MNELFRIVSGALRLDIEKVRSYTSFLADKLEKAGDAASAARLRNLLTESDHQLRPTQLSATRPVPVDSESRFPLLERVVARTNAEPPIVLSARQSATVTEFISIAKSYAQLEAQGIETSLGLLMYGPPGCGKSRLARHVAADLGLELYVVRLDGIISSYLGSTSKNIRALFDLPRAIRAYCFLTSSTQSRNSAVIRRNLANLSGSSIASSRTSTRSRSTPSCSPPRITTSCWMPQFGGASATNSNSSFRRPTCESSFSTTSYPQYLGPTRTSRLWLTSATA